MAEAILALYSSNSWTFSDSPKTKRHLHWIIWVTDIFIPGQKSHFIIIHAITSLASLVLVVIALINGIAALWFGKFRKNLVSDPLCRRFSIISLGSQHFYQVWNVFNTSINCVWWEVCFLFEFIGMMRLYYGSKYGYFSGAYGLTDVNVDSSPYLMSSVISTTITSLAGALIELYSQTLTILDG